MRSRIRAASYSAISANTPNTSLLWAVVVSTIPLVSDRTATPALVEGGDDVDQIAQVASEPVNLPDEQGVAAAQIGQAGVPLWPVGFGAGDLVRVDLQAALGRQRVEL